LLLQASSFRQGVVSRDLQVNQANADRKHPEDNKGRDKQRAA
jgi:hypothetical protein